MVEGRGMLGGRPRGVTKIGKYPKYLYLHIYIYIFISIYLYIYISIHLKINISISIYKSIFNTHNLSIHKKRHAPS